MLNLFRRVDHPTLIIEYLNARRGDWAHTNYLDNRRFLTRAAPALTRNPTRPDIIRLLDSVERASGKRTADRTRIALSGYLNWLVDKGTLTGNPTANMKSRASHGGRERVLTELEIRALWHATEPSASNRVPEDYCRIVRLLLLTGQRCAEIGGLAWMELDVPSALITFPGQRVKNRRTHRVPLSDLAIAQLPPRREDHPHVFGFRRGRPFDGWSTSKRFLDAQLIGMPHWTNHDLRRTCATGLAQLGVKQEVTEAILNHKTGKVSGVAAVYNRYEYAAEKREALDAWADELRRIVGIA